MSSASAPTATVVNTQFSIYFKESITLQLINGISHDLQTLLKYFSGKAIFTLFLVPLATCALLATSSLLKPHKLPEVSE